MTNRWIPVGHYFSKILLFGPLWPPNPNFLLLPPGTLNMIPVKKLLVISCLFLKHSKPFRGPVAHFMYSYFVILFASPQPRPPRNNAASPHLIICCKSQKWISPKIYMSKNSYPPYLPLDDSYVPIYMTFTQQMYLAEKQIILN